MQGAKEYANLFTTGQRGRLYLLSSQHARGKTFSIYLLPAGVTFTDWAARDKASIVEVYGVTGGSVGWTETYGWLHTGRWVAAFESLVAARQAEIAAAASQAEQDAADAAAAEAARVEALLAAYP
jgi:hypothetical protein